MNKYFFIELDNTTYRCSYAQIGWSYAQCYVQVKASIFGIPYWKTVHKSSKGFYKWSRDYPALASDVTSAYPERLDDWYRWNIEYYLDYQEAWSKIKK